MRKKSLIEAFSEISKLNFKTIKMQQKMKAETKMSNNEEIASIFLILEYPKPSCPGAIILFVFYHKYKFQTRVFGNL
jgi:hypothetical protein